MLFINSLDIENFKNIKNATLKFDKINLIEGETGEGKSAIFQSIVLALCNYVEGSLLEYVNHDALKSKIVQNFNFKNIEYINEIEISEKGSNRKLKFNEEFYQRSDVNKYIEANILDPHLTLYSNVSEQGKTSSILFESPAKSLETLKKIFKVDRINEKVEEIKLKIKELESNIKVINAEKLLLENKVFNIHDLPELPNINIKELEEKLFQLEKDKEEFYKQQSTFSIYNERLKKYNEATDLKVKLEKESKELEESKISLKSRLIEEIDFNVNEYLNISNNINQLKNKVSEFSSNRKLISDYEKKIENLNNKLKDLQIELDSIKIERLGRCQYNKENIKEIDTQIINKSSEVLQVESELKLVKLGKCPTCGSTNFKSSTKELEDRIELLNKEIKEFKSNKSNIEEEIRKYEDKSNTQKLLQQKQQSISNNIVDKTEELNNLTSLKNNILYNVEEESETIFKLKGEEIKKDSLESQKIKYENIKDQNNLINTKIKDLDNLLNKKQGTLDSLNNIEKPEEFKITVNFNEQEFISVSNSIRDYKNIVIRREEISRLNKDVEEQRKQNYKDIEIKFNSIVENQKKAQILGETQKVLNKDFSAYIIDKKTKYINLKMNDFFQRAYNGKYQIKFEQNDSGNKIGFYYSENGKDWYSTITLSGFERQLFSISFRLALSSIQNLGIFLVDEIDSDASSTKSLQLYKILLNEKSINQIFIISHCDSTKEYISQLANSKVFTIDKGKVI